MTLFKVFYEGVVDADTENDAEVFVSQNRHKLIHKATKEISKEKDFNAIEKHFDILWNVILTDEKYNNIDPYNAICLLKDYSTNSYIFQFKLENTDERFGLLKFSEEKTQNAENMALVEEDIQFAEVSKTTASLVIASWIKK